MAKKTLGYTQLQWTCPNCRGNNPGPEKVCIQCGAPQPDGVEFKQVKGAELIQDEAVAARVKAGPDIHCPYCQARNPGDAEVCSQCGGDLVSGDKRESGQVLGAYQDGPVAQIPCPNCGAENPGTAAVCSQCGAGLQSETEPSEPTSAGRLQPSSKPARRMPVGVIILLVVICIAAAALIFWMTRTETLTGTVQEVGWERSIAIEGLVPVEYSDWLDQIPTDAEIGNCSQEVRSVESEPQPNAEEVCGTPYSVDTGSGFAEVVQDCEYHVYDEVCTYSVIEWALVDTATLSGGGFQPEWPDPALSSEQRLGQSSEDYVVTFDTDQGNLVYNLSDYTTFQMFQIGSSWNLVINAFGNVVSVEP